MKQIPASILPLNLFIKVGCPKKMGTVFISKNAEILQAFLLFFFMVVPAVAAHQGTGNFLIPSGAEWFCLINEGVVEVLQKIFYSKTIPII
jgi:hypothetical protein